MDNNEYKNIEPEEVEDANAAAGATATGATAAGATAVGATATGATATDATAVGATAAGATAAGARAAATHEAEDRNAAASPRQVRLEEFDANPRGGAIVRRRQQQRQYRNRPQISPSWNWYDPQRSAGEFVHGVQLVQSSATQYTLRQASDVWSGTAPPGRAEDLRSRRAQGRPLNLSRREQRHQLRTLRSVPLEEPPQLEPPQLEPAQLELLQQELPQRRREPLELKPLQLQPPPQRKRK